MADSESIKDIVNKAIVQAATVVMMVETQKQDPSWHQPQTSGKIRDIEWKAGSGKAEIQL